MGRPFSVTPKIIEIMNSNSHKSMIDVVFQIRSTLKMEERQARGYYVRLVQEGMAKGKIEYKKRGRKASHSNINQKYNNSEYNHVNMIYDVIDPDFDQLEYNHLVSDVLNKEYKYEEAY